MQIYCSHIYNIFIYGRIIMSINLVNLNRVPANRKAKTEGRKWRINTCTHVGLQQLFCRLDNRFPISNWASFGRMWGISVCLLRWYKLSIRCCTLNRGYSHCALLKKKKNYTRQLSKLSHNFKHFSFQYLDLVIVYIDKYRLNADRFVFENSWLSISFPIRSLISYFHQYWRKYFDLLSFPYFILVSDTTG